MRIGVATETLEYTKKGWMIYERARFCRQVKRATRKCGLRWSYALGAIRSQDVPTRNGGHTTLCPIQAIRFLAVGVWEDFSLASRNLSLTDSERMMLSRAIDCHMVYLNRREKKLRRKILRACGR